MATENEIKEEEEKRKKEEEKIKADKEKVDKESVDIDKIVAEKLAAKEKEIEVKYAKKFAEDTNKYEEDLIKQMEDTAIESSGKADSNDNPVIKQVTEGLETFAEKIKQKREKEKEIRDQKDKEAEYNATLEELKRYKFKEQLEQVKKDEPYLADVIDDAIEEGSLNSIEQLNVVFNDSLRNRLKTSYMYENAIKQAGGDPRTYLDNTGSAIDSVAKAEMRKTKLAEKKAKYRRK